ncbi:zinc finger, CCHC-type containing protein, partial [Tanacetum coccineum]
TSSIAPHETNRRSRNSSPPIATGSKEIKQGSTKRGDHSKTTKKGEASSKEKAPVIFMVQPWKRVTRQKNHSSFSLNLKISFPPMENDDEEVLLMVIQEEIGGHLIHLMYVDGGSASEFLYEHCFNQLHPEVKSRMIPTTKTIPSFFEYLYYELPEDVVSIIFGIILELQLLISISNSLKHHFLIFAASNLMTTSVGNNSVFRSFFEKQRLTGPNFIDWYRQLRLVLSTEDKENYLEHPIPAAPVALPGQQVPPEALAAHAAWVKGQKEVAVLMLLTMDLEIQRNLAHLGAYDMLQELKAMFSKQAEQELLQTVREFHTCKQEEGQSVSSHVLKMKGYIDNLERLGQPVGQNLALHEDSLPKKDANPALHAIRAGRVQKNQKNKPHKAAKGGHGKGKGKMGYAPNNAPFAPKPKTPSPPKKDNPVKDAICHQCGEVGHWRRNCPVYLAELMKKKKLSQGASASGSHGGSRSCESGALSLYVGDGHCTAVEAIGTYHLELPSGLVIVLNNCHYAPSITRGVISVSRLFDDGFINRFDENNVISVSKNNLVYFMAFP